MVMKLKKFFVSIFLVFIVLVSFGFGIYFGKSQCKTCPPEDIDFSLFWEAYHKLQEKFVDKEKINPKQIIYGAISGMVSSLEDPYTIFLTPEKTKKFMEEVKGTFEGIGAEVGIRKGQLQIISPLEGTPADKAGLRAGDKILKIDGKPTIDMTIDEAVNLMRGPKGTKVVLTIFREGWTNEKEIEIIRDVIEVPSLKWEIKEGNIAYLKLYQFSEKAIFDFKEAAIQILNSGAKKIILDLRNNPGGYLEVAQEISGWFLEKGDPVVIEDFGGGKEQKIFRSPGPSQFSDYPIVVLINGGSASGAEILAGALRDNRGILLIGEKTFGKGSIQELEKLKEGALKITVAKWLTPKGELITDKGLEPDIKIEMKEEDYEEGRDPQLDKALEVIKQL
jgi:carboxyl-terminal processing protease